MDVCKNCSGIATVKDGKCECSISVNNEKGIQFNNCNSFKMDRHQLIIEI